MIKDTSIEEVRNANISEVVEAYIKLDKHNKACCPFHDEKTPSFSVDEKKGIYKCFGCGEGGDAIHFVMEKDRLDFISAVEKVADICGIHLEHEAIDESAYKEKINNTKEEKEVIDFAVKKYRKILWSDRTGKAWNYIHKYRTLTEDTLAKWQIGYAPNAWRTLTPTLVNNGKYKPALNTGIINTSKGINYDTYRDRIIFPIKNHKGEFVGLGGRIIPGEDPSDATKKQPKYINSLESKIYHKSKILFGLYEAHKAIRKTNTAILVEGYMDVITLHQAGFENAVATCGTALTEQQARVLSRLCKKIIILRDGDDAGRNAIQKDIPKLIAQGLKTEVAELPQDVDPDDIIHAGSEDLKDILNDAEDGILLLATEWSQEAGDDVFDTSQVIIDILKMISLIPASILQAEYLKKVCKANRWKLTDIRKQFESILKQKEKEISSEDDPLQNLPEDVDKDEVIQYGFFERLKKHKTGYYFLNGDGSSGKAMTNFVIKPLYHIDSETDNRRMISINNGFQESILELPSDKMLSADYVLGTFYKSGFYLPREGFGKNHLYKILNKISGSFPRAYEIDSLGWQPEGFFAFNNFIYRPAKINDPNGKLEQYNDYGIASVDDQLFLSPSVSKIQEHYRDTDSIYENDKFLTYTKSPINFEEWASLFSKVYEQNSWMAIPFAVATAMKDLIRPVTKIPHLYLYGQIQSGKSEFGESISYLFFSGKDSQGEPYKPMNLNQGTTYAFHNRMERFANAPNALNEFDENAIPDEWFRAIKAAYDGEGREKGRKEKNRAMVQKVKCTLILMGQYLGSKDDNSVLTRSLPLALRRKDHRTDEEVKNFFRLKELEKEGLSGILLEIMNWRPLFESKFKEKFLSISKEMKENARKEGDNISDRIVKNIACMRATIELISEKIKLPFSVPQYNEYAFSFMRKMSALVAKTSGTSEFWGMVEFLLDRGQITDGFDFFIESRDHINLRYGKSDTENKAFTAPKKMLFIRLSNIHKLYREQTRRTGADQGMNETTLLLYMKEQPYWIGNAKSETFTTPDGKKIKTSCIVIDYDLLDVNLERYEAKDDREETTLVGEIIQEARETTKEGVFKFLIAIIQSEGGEDGEIPKTETIPINCFTSDPTIMWEASHDKKIEVTGWLNVNKSKYRTIRTMDVTSWKPESQIKQEKLQEDNEEEPF